MLLQGEPASEPQAVTFSQLQALISTSNIEHFYELHQIPLEDNKTVVTDNKEMCEFIENLPKEWSVL